MKFSYMGTKRAIAPIVADIAKLSPPGPFLDLFCGIGCVGQTVASDRQVWANDVQRFAFTVGKCVFTSADPVDLQKTAVQQQYLFKKNFEVLSHEYGQLVEEERHALSSNDVAKITEFYSKVETVTTSHALEMTRNTYNGNPYTFPFCLFSICYPGTYLGLLQCLELDSLRYAIHTLREGEALSSSDHDWLLIALCKALSNCSTTTGHFAQFLTPNPNNIKKFVKKRQRSLLNEYHFAKTSCAPSGDEKWRKFNKVFNMDAISLLDSLNLESSLPAVIYADPPYTEDQYSRYYHLYETVINYDYPPIECKARYRNSRFRSDFSLKSAAKQEITKLISKCHDLGADLILSYPQNGLLGSSIDAIPTLIREFYRYSEVMKLLPHIHSSFGAANTNSKREITEIIFRGHN